MQGLVNVPIEHHPTIGDTISNRYLKVMFKITKKGPLPTPAMPGRFCFFPRNDWTSVQAIDFDKLVKLWLSSFLLPSQKFCYCIIPVDWYNWGCLIREAPQSSAPQNIGNLVPPLLGIHYIEILNVLLKAKNIQNLQITCEAQSKHNWKGQQWARKKEPVMGKRTEFKTFPLQHKNWGQPWYC